MGFDLPYGEQPQPYRIRINTVSAALEYTVDNGVTWTAVSGSSSAIANNTLLGNVSGSAAAPIALTAAQALTLLGVTPYTDVRSAIMIRAQALCGATVNVLNGTEFDKPSDFVHTQVSGAGGSAVVSTALGSGVCAMTTGASAGSSGKISLGGAALGAQITNLKTGPWYCYFRAALSTAIDNQTTNELMLNASTGLAMLAVGVGGSLSTTNWRIRSFDHAGNPWISTATIAQTIDTNFHDVEFVNDGTNVKVYIDAVQQATFAAASIVQGDPVYMQATDGNGTTAAARGWNLDRMYTVTPSN
jgi:hypothetical protein